MIWHRPWWQPWKRRPSRRDTIDAIIREWGWSREGATHAVDVWGFYPWERIS